MDGRVELLVSMVRFKMKQKKKLLDHLKHYFEGHLQFVSVFFSNSELVF